MMWTDNPLRDFERHDAEQESKLKRLPKCCLCDEHIQQETAVHFRDKWICDDCLDNNREETLEDAV